MDSIKQLILESAEVKFLQHNYDDVFLTEICRDAGITTGAFYRRFSEKRELIRVIVDLAMSDLKDGIKEYQAKRNEQFSKERMGENWLSILVYQHRNGFQIMLRHAPVMASLFRFVFHVCVHQFIGQGQRGCCDQPLTIGWTSLI